MKRSDDRILTTHVGSLARSHELLDAMGARADANGSAPLDDATFEALVHGAVTEVVGKQVAAGIDVVTDGEQGKLGFLQYLGERLEGYEIREGRLPVPSSWQLEIDMFPEYYAQYMQKYGSGSGPTKSNLMVCVAPVSYRGHDAVQRDIARLKAAVAEHDVAEAFLPAASPMGFGLNEYYATEDEYMAAVAEALREEYLAISESGLILQVDDPWLIELLMEDPSVAPEDRRAAAAKHVELINHALRGIPPERVRLHTCYGLNHGPRLHDVAFADVVDFMLSIDAGAYSFEVGNPRHQHEWRIWEDTKLPEGKILMPGFVCHAHNFVEHPELIADGIATYAGLVGRENVIASADCGFSSRAIYNPEVHPTVAWAKLEALAEGARLATERLW
jgi:5-methyltetrahydropteroyltriglutamate--homocysteine methyltransferase